MSGIRAIGWSFGDHPGAYGLSKTDVPETDMSVPV